MDETLIIGFGNPLRGDDGIGWHIAHYLTEQNISDNVEILTAHQLVPEHAEPISRAEVVILVDAAIRGIPGVIECTQLQPAELSPTAFSHHLSPEMLLSASFHVYGESPAGFLCTVTGQTFEFSTELSIPVQNAFPALVSAVESIIKTGHIPDGVVQYH